ncbi:MAG: ribonuclease HII [Rhodospirillaceae bacterium]|nr:ribonuclease HII [Rhodospirillaceae bacterium]
MPNFRYEQDILSANPTAVIAGVDEAGRGPWAGPVMAGAAILNPQTLPDDLRHGLDDSKKLTPERREQLFERLSTCNAVVLGVGQADVAEIDQLNILRATYLAMTRAVAALGRNVDVALVDGNRAPPLACTVRTIVKGDAQSLSIAAASIAAKVTRDRLMLSLAQVHPGYGWETNMGYGTAAHQSGLSKFGITPHHRRSFAPIRALMP